MPLPPEEVVAERVHFRAGSYRLEGELLYPESALPLGAVVVANPHPLLGGDMRNNVVRELTERLAERGLITLRFNYRGVGSSEGPMVDVSAHLARFWDTSHVPDELDHHADLEAAVDFLRTVSPAGLPMAAVGYSFGCVLLPLVKMIDELAALVLIAPTVAKHNYDSYFSVKRPMLVIAPEDDFATEAAVVRHWFDQLSAPKQLVTTRLDNHFFRGHEEWLTETIFAYLSAHWS